jgi:PAS domain S-box-containing protein/diguanylate cyclase (GGDEF)-like protein
MRDAIERCLALSRQARSEQGDALAQTLSALEAALKEAQSALQPADMTALDATLALDLTGYVTAWSPGAQLMFGYTAEEVIGQHVLFLYAEDDDDGNIAELFFDHSPGAAAARTEVRRRKKNGEIIWVHLDIELRHEDGEPAGMLVRLSEANQALSDLDKVNLHARIIEDSEQGVLITDAHERIVSINSSFTRITGYTPAESIGKTPDLLRSGVHDADFRAKVREAMQGGGPWRGEIIGKRKNGELFPQSVTISAVRDQNGKISHTFSLFSDISVHKDAEARTQRMANYDPLTGLPNLCLLSQLVEQALTESKRSGEHGALMVIEITRVGAISDTLGHEIGKSCCAKWPHFPHSLREGDMLARLEGHRFAIALLLKSASTPASSPRSCWPRWRRRLRSTRTACRWARISASLRTARMARCADPDPLRRRGGQGGASIESNFLFYSEEMNQRAKEHLRIESELRRPCRTTNCSCITSPR